MRARVTKRASQATLIGQCQHHPGDPSTIFFSNPIERGADVGRGGPASRVPTRTSLSISALANLESPRRRLARRQLLISRRRQCSPPALGFAQPRGNCKPEPVGGAPADSLRWWGLPSRLSQLRQQQRAHIRTERLFQQPASSSGSLDVSFL
jgi:hypothetical protein